ncbi:MAG: Calx-beta domain-containing protein [Verrucomicrobiaceae bacterium]
MGDQFDLSTFVADLSLAATAGGTYTIANITGSGNDFIVGGGNYDVLFGGDGNDFIFGGNYFSGGATQVVEDDGNDFMDGGRGDDQIFGDDANGAEGDRVTGISLDGTVWHDLDLDGVKDATEVGIPNVKVRLYKASDDSLFSETITDSAGHWELLGLDPLDYYMIFTAPTGYAATLQNVGDALPASDLDSAGELDTDSDVDATGRTPTFQLDYDEAETTITAGFTGAPNLTVTTAAVNEGNSGGKTNVTFTLTLSGPSKSTIVLNYATGNLAATTADKDYTAVNSTITFAPGEMSKSITVSVTGDDKYETDEDFKLTLTPQTPSLLNGAPASITTSTFIINDDAAPEFSITDASVTETESGQTVKLVIKLTNPSYQTVSVAYQTSDEIDAVTGLKVAKSATAGADYNVLSNIATFLPGDVQKEIFITVLGDTIDEYDESFFVKLFNPSNAKIKDDTGVITIADNDAAPTVMIKPLVADGVAPLNYRTTVFETDYTAQAVTMQVVLSGLTEKTITVRWDTARGTAISDSYDETNEPIDFTNNATSSDLATAADSDTTLTFAPNGLSTQTQTLTVWVQGDYKDEGDEFFYVNLLNADNATTITNNHVVVRIVDNDTGPTAPGHPYDVRFSKTDFRVVEGDTGTATGYVTLVRSLSGAQAYSVLSITGGTATFGSDYTTDSPITRMLVVFNVGESVKQIPIYVIGDNIHEADETIQLSLRKPTGEIVKGYPGTATFTIEDDDDAGVIFEAVPSPNFVTEGGVYQFKIKLVDLNDPAHPLITAQDPVTVNYSTQGLTAVAASDYNAVAGSFTFNIVNGNTTTINVTTLNNAIAEETEQFRLRLTGITGNAVAINSFADGNITDDDLTSVSVKLYVDANGNGYKDSGEAAFAGAATNVTMTDSAGTVHAAVEGPAGTYTASVLLGNVHLAVAGTGVLEGWEVTTDNDNQDGDFDGGISPFTNVGFTFGFTIEMPEAAETTGRGGTDDVIFGGPGNDYIDAGAGDDHVVGGHWQTATSSNSPINQGTYSASIIANIGASITDPQTAPIWSIDPSGLGGGSISGQLWVDTNNSNVQDEGLFTSEGVVYLLDGEGNVVQVVATTTGNYSFTGLYAGTYIVEFELPEGQQFVTPSIGGVAVNSDAIVAGRSAKLTLATDTSALNNIDAGLETSGTLPVASGSGIKWAQTAFHVAESSTLGVHVTLTVTMLRSNASATEAVVWSMRNGTAVSPTNYVTAQGVAIFAVGETLKTFEIEIVSTGINICDAKDFTLTARKPTGQPLRGGEATVYIHGAGAGSDTDDDTIYAGEDWDVVMGDSGYIDANALPSNASTKVHDLGGLGKDTINGDDGPDYLNGQLGDDILAGNEGSDEVYGGYGNDRIIAELDDDNIFGQHGTDTVAGTWDNVLIYLSPTKLQFSRDLTLDISDSEFTLSSIESAELFGGDADNTFQIDGWLGEAFIFGEGGTDALQVTNDVNMTLANASVFQKLLYQLTRGFDLDANLTLMSTGTAYHIAGFENVQLTGGASANTIDASGYSKSVTLQGAGGDDTLIGGSAADTFLFDADTALGTDTVIGNGGADTLDFSPTAAGVTVNLSTLASQTVVLGNLSIILSSGDVENVTGGSGADTLAGNSGENVIIGGGGADNLAGGAGSDTYKFDTDLALGGDTITELAANVGQDMLDFSETSGQVIDLDMALTTAQIINANLTITLVGGGFEDATGGSLADNIKGNSLANQLHGGAGDDTLFGAQGDDYLDGGTGTDTLDGGDGSDYIKATADSNFTLANTTLLRNGSDVDNLNLIERAYLTGGTSNNTFTLTGWTGNAEIFGLGGTDILVFTGDVNMTLTGAAFLDTLSLAGGAYTFTLHNVETYQLTGGVSANTMDASGYISDGDVTLNGGPGNDILVGSPGMDILYGGSGNDLITGGDSYDTINGGTGTDTLYETNASSVILTNAGYIINGGTDSVTSIESLYLFGTAGNDVFIISGAPAASVTLNSLGGTDYFHAYTTANVTTTTSSLAFSNIAATFALTGFEIAWLTGDSGANRLDGSGFAGPVLIEGLGGNDTLIGGSGNDVLVGGDGDDTYTFDTDTALGTDTISDTSGSDTLDFSASSNAIVVDLTLVSNAVNANLTVNWSASVSIENVIGGSAGDNLTGNASDNMLTGGGGNDNLNGGAGNDTYQFDTDTALGTDNLTDTGGTDTLDFSASSNTITVNLALGSNVVNANLTLNYFGSFENITGGSAGDSLTGNASANGITGGGGVDTLNGAGGNDTYFFDTDNALGNDTIVDSAGTDTLDFSASSNAVTIDLASTTNTVNANLTLTWGGGVTLENVIGGSANDTIRGNSSANTLTGGAGNDNLDGRGGNDTYVFDTDASLGTDTISDSGGIDTLDFSQSSSAVSVNLDKAAVSGTVTNVVNVNLTLRWASSVILENLTGGIGDDTLIGNSSANTITGGLGDDILEGREGNNLLIGGLGDDTYLFDLSLAGNNEVRELVGEGDDTLDGAGGGLVDLTWIMPTFHAPDPTHLAFFISFTTSNTVEHSL